MNLSISTNPMEPVIKILNPDFNPRSYDLLTFNTSNTSCSSSFTFSLDIPLGLGYLLMSIVGIVGNVMLFVKVQQAIVFARLPTSIKVSQSRASFFILVTNLAFADLLIVTLPVWVTAHGMFNGRNILTDTDNITVKIFTVLVAFIESTCARVSIIFVMLIAVFRVMSLRLPMRIGQIFSARRTTVVIVLAWLLVIGLTVYSFHWSTQGVVYSNITGLCQISIRSDTGGVLPILGQVLAPFLLPGLVSLLALIYLLVFMFRMYRQKMKNLNENNSSYRPTREKDSLKTTTLIILFFLLFYMPWYLDGTLDFFYRLKYQTATDTYEFLTVKNCFLRYYWQHLCKGFFLFASSAVNPMLYGKTLVHASQQQTQLGLFRTLAAYFITCYRWLRMKYYGQDYNATDGDETDDEVEERGAKLEAVPGVCGKLILNHNGSVRPQKSFDSDSVVSIELSKFSLLSEHHSDHS